MNSFSIFLDVWYNRKCNSMESVLCDQGKTSFMRKMFMKYYILNKSLQKYFISQQNSSNANFFLFTDRSLTDVDFLPNNLFTQTSYFFSLYFCISSEFWVFSWFETLKWPKVFFFFFYKKIFLEFFFINKSFFFYLLFGIIRNINYFLCKQTT